MPSPARKPAGPAMAAAEAQLTTAELDLSYTRVTSPINGLAGNRQVDVGSYVGSPQPTVLTVVSSLDPVRFDFTISEADYLALRAGDAGAKAGKRSGTSPELELVLADGSVHPHKGRDHGGRTGRERRDRHAAPAGHASRIPAGCSGPASSAGSGSRSPRARTRS